MREGWLSELSVGDEVVVARLGRVKKESIETIDRITPTGRIIVKGVRYEPDGYVQLGGTWNRTKLTDINTYESFNEYLKFV